MDIHKNSNPLTSLGSAAYDIQNVQVLMLKYSVVNHDYA